MINQGIIIGVLAASLYMFHYVVQAIYNTIYSPLTKIPYAHRLARFTPLWILWNRFKGPENEIRVILYAHERYGRVVRLSPNEISVNSQISNVHHFHGIKVEKTHWYTGFMNYGTLNCMSSLTVESHSLNRRRIATNYSKSYIQGSERLHKITTTVLLRRLPEAIKKQGAKIDVIPLCFALGMDMVSGYIFGFKGVPDLTQNEAERQAHLQRFAASNLYENSFWTQEMHPVKTLISYFKPASAKKAVEAYCLQLCQHAEKDSVYDNVQKTTEDLGVASELLDHLKATSDVFSITLAWAIYELSRNPEIQNELREELKSLRVGPQCLPLAADLDKLDLLDRVIMETLRLRPTIPDGQPRVTRSESTMLDEFEVPPNIRISTYPYVLHHDYRTFENPTQWNPTRWIHDTNRKNLWAFGKGARGCIGKYLAIQLMKQALMAIYAKYETRVGISTEKIFLTTLDQLQVEFTQIH